MSANAYQRLAGIAAALLWLTLGGCAATDEVSDAALSGDPQAMLADGTRLNSRGAELVARGEKRLGEGREQVARGEAKISAGTNAVAVARQAYRNQSVVSGNAATPTAVETEAKALREIGDQWQDAIDEIRDGNALVDKGNKNIDRGQAEIREGRQLMERGSALVRNSERIRLGDKLIDVPATENL